MTITLTQLRITNDEHRTRCNLLLEQVKAKDLSGVVLFDNYYIQYYSGFVFIPTERPMAFVMNNKGEVALFVPRLEVEHAQANSIADRVDHYKEYPDSLHPMEILKRTLADMGVMGRVGADEDGYPWVWGYRGPALSKVANVTVIAVRDVIEDQMAIKSPAELALIRESCVWGNLAHVLLQRYTAVGATETEVSERASQEATKAMTDAIGPIYKAANALFNRADAGYRGQIGRNAAIPHALAHNITFQSGDVLVTGAGAPIWGYLSELERTMILGSPSDEQRVFFEHMLALQNTAFEAMMPGKLCSDVDTAVRAYYEKHDLVPYWKHHSGHCVGLRYHEGPFLDIGDHTELKPGMVFTVEPGLYVAGLGGFRHSDTALITETGVELLTYYPRDLDSLTLPV